MVTPRVVILYMKVINGPFFKSVAFLCIPARYCGPLTIIENGYVSNSTGVTFGHEATYTCFPGFKMAGQATVKCKDDGTWEDAPQCQGKQCYLQAGMLTQHWENTTNGVTLDGWSLITGNNTVNSFNMT